MVLLGFVKKVVIADRLARAIEPFYETHAESTLDAAAAMLLFTCQIYVDFSSYSDIAIGIGLLLGYNIRANFNLPFVVPSIPERWRRWHISLSSWFKEYVYIPLGGAKKGLIFTLLNVMMVFIISGIWHGNEWKYLAWGGLNGVFIVPFIILKKHLT